MKQKETQQETMSKEKRVVFFEGKSWYHRTKELQDDLTTKYGKKGGFETPEEAEKSYWEYEKRYQKKQRDLQIAKMQKTDVMLGDYLEYWFENIFSPRIETTTRMVGAYTLYNLILPSMEADIKLRYVSVEYLDALLERVAKICPSAGNKGRELLSIAMKDAARDKFISYNPMPETKPYSRAKPKVRVLGKEKLKVFLEAASKNPWYLEILLGLFCGLRKGDDDDKIRLNQRKPSKYKGLSRFGPEKNLQRINKFMKERPIFYKNLIQMKENFRFYLRCFYCITKVVILQFNSENRTELARNG
jgi:integrase